MEDVVFSWTGSLPCSHTCGMALGFALGLCSKANVLGCGSLGLCLKTGQRDSECLPAIGRENSKCLLAIGQDPLGGSEAGEGDTGKAANAPCLEDRHSQNLVFHTLHQYGSNEVRERIPIWSWYGASSRLLARVCPQH